MSGRGSLIKKGVRASLSSKTFLYVYNLHTFSSFIQIISLNALESKKTFLLIFYTFQHFSVLCQWMKVCIQMLSLSLILRICICFAYKTKNTSQTVELELYIHFVEPAHMKYSKTAVVNYCFTYIHVRKTLNLKLRLYSTCI